MPYSSQLLFCCTIMRKALKLSTLLKQISLLIFTLFTIACKTTQHTSIPKTLLTSEKGSIQLTIEALDLSEDMSKLSTGNDELLIFIYALKDSSVLDEYLFSQHFKLDAKKSSIFLPQKRSSPTTCFSFSLNKMLKRL